MKSNFKTLILYVVLVAVVLVTVTTVLGGTEKDELVYSDIYDLFAEEKVRSFTVTQEAELIMKVRSDTAPDNKDKDSTVTYRLLDYELFRKHVMEELVYGENGQKARGIIEDYDLEEPTNKSWWVTILPYALVMIVFVAMFVYMMRLSGGGKGSKIGGFGKSRARINTPDKNRVRFTDVAGADEEKAELEEVVEFLKDPERFKKLGAKIPRGVLLMGPPGTGKTLLAKAVAGEAEVPFYSISGSDFVEMYVGVGASRVRDLFETAKRHPASIIFIDEIDAVGRHRGAGLGGGHDEREQTLNQLLVEMDGFNGNDAVIVIAATNRPDILDPALLRPGRFDRQVTVGYPDLKGREDILKVHARKKPFEADVDLSKVAKTTVGFTGADLANLLNEAALIAARKRKALIGMNDIEEASLKIIVGTPKKSMQIKESEKRKTAYHEAGHAIVAYRMETQDPVTLISIIPSGRALGYTLTPPTEDKYSVYRKAMQEEISMLLGGRVAEAVVFDDISGGASNDIQRASQIARKMVMRFGMSDKLGPILYGSEHSDGEVFLGRDFSNDRNYSEETASLIDAEIKRIVEEAYKMAEEILRADRAKLDFIAEFLVKNEVMDEEQFKAAMENDVTFEELEAMTEEKRRRSEEENERRRKIIEEEKAAKEAAEKAAAESGDSTGEGDADPNAADADAEGEKPEENGGEDDGEIPH
ncbi:MAG: ATP-dependent zinc metalloprotease FtsH [Ruminococcaceae bacterium]|nr:ATP-dependent zinc metalloprotease FtsH [Oscillospiraceae bacterium]